jgi:hypothetical protein
MKKSAQVAIVMTGAALVVVLTLIPTPGFSRASNDEKPKATAEAKAITQNFEANARTLTIYDRQRKRRPRSGHARSTTRRFFRPTRTSGRGQGRLGAGDA